MSVTFVPNERLATICFLLGGVCSISMHDMPCSSATVLAITIENSFLILRGSVHARSYTVLILISFSLFACYAQRPKLLQTLRLCQKSCSLFSRSMLTKLHTPSELGIFFGNMVCNFGFGLCSAKYQRRQAILAISKCAHASAAA